MQACAGQTGRVGGLACLGTNGLNGHACGMVHQGRCRTQLAEIPLVKTLLSVRMYCRTPATGRAARHSRLRSTSAAGCKSVQPIHSCMQGFEDVALRRACSEHQQSTPPWHADSCKCVCVAVETACVCAHKCADVRALEGSPAPPPHTPQLELEPIGRVGRPERTSLLLPSVSLVGWLLQPAHP